MRCVGLWDRPPDLHLRTRQRPAARVLPLCCTPFRTCFNRVRRGGVSTMTALAPPANQRHVDLPHEFGPLSGEPASARTVRAANTHCPHAEWRHSPWITSDGCSPEWRCSPRVYGIKSGDGAFGPDPGDRRDVEGGAIVDHSLIASAPPSMFGCRYHSCRYHSLGAMYCVM